MNGQMDRLAVEQIERKTDRLKMLTDSLTDNITPSHNLNLTNSLNNYVTC